MRLSQSRAVQEGRRRRQRVRHQVEDAALQALRRHHRGRIDARPALAFEPDLGPGMRLGLPHDEVAADRIPFAAEVTGDDARRHARRAHHRGVGRGEVAAEATLRIEQRRVHRIDAGDARLERVFETAGCETSRARRARTRRRCPRARASRAPAPACADCDRRAAGSRSGGPDRTAARWSASAGATPRRS